MKLKKEFVVSNIRENEDEGRGLREERPASPALPAVHVTPACSVKTQTTSTFLAQHSVHWRCSKVT